MTTLRMKPSAPRLSIGSLLPAPLHFSAPGA